MQMLESRAFQLSEIARFFRVPSHLINDTEKSTSSGTGIEQLNIGFLTYTLRPYLTRWEAVIRDALLPPEERGVVVVEHNVEGLLRADSAARANLYASMVQNGLIDAERSAPAGEPAEVDGGERRRAHGADEPAPLTSLGAQPAPAPAPTDPQVAKAELLLRSRWTCADSTASSRWS